MYCKLFAGYTNDDGCNQCDINAGYPVGSWRETCHRDVHHPLLSSLTWWLKPKSFTFKLLIITTWIANRFPLNKKWFVWSNRDGWHVGRLKMDWRWLEPRPLEETAND